jgi:cholesterol oxidase
MPVAERYDYIVIGSGFGGSVAAMRLAEKGYRVLVIEKGRRWMSNDFPRTDWNIRKYLWLPALRFFGFLRLSFFREVFVLSGVGVGGGSLVYANTHMYPNDSFFTHPQWASLARWKDVLKPCYERALFMLGSEQYTKENAEDKVLDEVARDMGRESAVSRVDYVGVHFGDSASERDPYFGGLGPLRRGCTECAACMTGCRHNAKNTLDKNYLWFAENMFGARLLAGRRATRIEVDGQGYRVVVRSSTRLRDKEEVFHAEGVVVSAGVLGTLDLLFRQKYVHRTLPGISDRLGENVLTNSEMLAGVTAADRKLNHGVAISTAYRPDADTTVELCKYGNGSGAMLHLAVMAAGPGAPFVRIVKSAINALRHPVDLLRSAFRINVATRSVVLLVMQSVRNSMRMGLKRGILGYRLSFRNDKREKVPSYVAVGQEVLHRYAARVKGVAYNSLPEVLMGLPTTAHILGGCPMGAGRDTGVVDAEFRVHGYKNFFVLDGSVIQANLGVNPSLTITALSEYAMDRVPAKPGSRVQTLMERIASVKATTV